MNSEEKEYIFCKLSTFFYFEPQSNQLRQLTIIPAVFCTKSTSEWIIVNVPIDDRVSKAASVMLAKSFNAPICIKCIFLGLKWKPFLFGQIKPWRADFTPQIVNSINCGFVSGPVNLPIWDHDRYQHCTGDQLLASLQTFPNKNRSKTTTMQKMCVGCHKSIKMTYL